MKYILSLLICLLTTWSCNEEGLGRFIPFDEVCAYTYLESEEEFSEWASLARHAGLSGSMNLKVISLTCFVVKNDAVRAWLAESGYKTIEDIDPKEARDLLSYHIIQGKAYEFSEFQNGRFADPTALGYFLTSLFVSGENSGVFINGTNRLIQWDIPVVNGIIHVLEDVLIPPTETMSDFIKQDKYSIFKAMIDTTATDSLLKETEIKGSDIKSFRTLLVVPNSIYEDAGINNIKDLIDSISSGNDQYTENINPLNQYARYHMLLGNYTTVDFKTVLEAEYVSDEGTLLRTRVDTCMIHLQDDGINFRFNPIAGQSATFLGINYNMLTVNGVVHELDKMIKVTTPPLLKYIYDFTDPINNPSLPSLLEKAELKFNLEKELVAPNITWKSTPENKEDAVAVYVNDNQIRFNLAKWDWVEFQIPPIPKGAYKVSLRYQKIKNVGANFQIVLDGENFGNVRIGYRSATQLDIWSLEFVGNQTFEKTTTHSFKCVVEQAGETVLDVLIFEPIIPEN